MTIDNQYSFLLANSKVRELIDLAITEDRERMAQLCEAKAEEWQKFADRSYDPDKVRELEAMVSAAFQCSEAIRESV